MNQSIGVSEYRSDGVTGPKDPLGEDWETWGLGDLKPGTWNLELETQTIINNQ